MFERAAVQTGQNQDEKLLVLRERVCLGNVLAGESCASQGQLKAQERVSRVRTGNPATYAAMCSLAFLDLILEKTFIPLPSVSCSSLHLQSVYR